MGRVFAEFSVDFNRVLVFVLLRILNPERRKHHLWWVGKCFCAPSVTVLSYSA